MFKKLSKYKDFKIAIKKMWHLKLQTIPAIVEAMGKIKKNDEKTSK